MPYNIVISKTAQKQLLKLSTSIREKLMDAIEELADNPRPAGCKKLKGYEAYRLRQGDYRIIYTVIDNQLLIEVLTAGHRKDVYDQNF